MGPGAKVSAEVSVRAYKVAKVSVRVSAKVSVRAYVQATFEALNLRGTL